MFQILYTSEALKPFKDDELKSLLEAARSNNAIKSITGMLLYCNSNFIQLLEGHETDLMELFELISADPRHIKVETIMSGNIMLAQFPDWSMGYKILTPQQLTSLDQHQDLDVSGFIRRTKPYKLLKLMSGRSWH